jgi:hypothetical protein
MSFPAACKAQPFSAGLLAARLKPCPGYKTAFDRVVPAG